MKTQKLKSVGRILLRYVLPVVAAIGVLIVVIAWLAGAFVEKIEPGTVARQERDARGLETAPVRQITRDVIEESVGTLKAARRTEIAAKVLAVIDDITVSAGEQVEKGMLLVRLDDQQFQTQVRQAERGRRAAESKFEKAEIDFERAQMLFEGGAIPKSQFDDAQAAYTTTQAELQRAEEALAESKVVLSYAELRAPAAGRVVDRLADPGNMARPGRPLLVLYDAGSLRLEAPVTEALAVQLQVGDTLPVLIDALDREVESRIDEIVPQSDAPSRSMLVKVALPPDGEVYEGMFGRLRVPAGKRQAFCMPREAVQQIGQLEFAGVLDAEGTVQRRLIKTGRPCPSHGIEVLSGLEAGETVVLADRPCCSKEQG